MILKVKQNENPYDIIGNYIEKHITVIDDVIAVISVDGKIRNELLLVDGEIGSANNFVWQIDWWEGEENVELIDFFFVSDACKKNNSNDLISKRQAIDASIEAVNSWNKSCSIGQQKRIENYIKQLPSAQPKKGKWIKYPSDSELYVCSECASFGDTKDSFCRFCGADMREVTE